MTGTPVQTTSSAITHYPLISKNMKPLKLIALGIAAYMCAQDAFAAPPRMTTLPDMAWANQKGYVTEYQTNGRTRRVINYADAFIDEDFTNLENAINALMQDYNLPLIKASAQSEQDVEDEVFEEAFESKSDGSSSKSTTWDDIARSTAADIVLNVGWSIHKVGFNYTMSYRLDAQDSYSHKSVATINGETDLVPSSTSYSAVLKLSAAEQMPAFIEKLQKYFDDIQTNGREIRVMCRVAANSAHDFDTVIGEETIGTHIYNWISDNAINHQATEVNATSNRLVYEQVRIPLRDGRNRPLQARNYIQQLCKVLGQQPFNLKVENKTVSLGYAIIYITE